MNAGDIGVLLYLLFVLIIGCIILGLIIGLPILAWFLFYRWLKRRGHRNLGLAALSVPIFVFLFFAYHMFLAVHPNDDFYADEFRDITGLHLSDSSKILKKNASYPEFHGDYCSAALIEVEADFYDDLKNTIMSDSRFNSDELVGSSELNKVTDKKDMIFGYKASRRPESDHYYFIGFVKDEFTIVIEKCIT